LDGSVTETNIHYPTDIGLLDNAARVLSRIVKQARARLQPVRPPTSNGFAIATGKRIKWLATSAV